MAGDALDTRDGRPIDAQELLARAAVAEQRARRARDAAAQDLAIADPLRLDERTRTGIAAALERMVVAAEHSLLKALGAGGFPGIGPTLPLLRGAGLAADAELVAELLARARQQQLAAALPSHAPDDPARPSLVSRFVDHPQDDLADAARALLLAESRARGPETGRWQLPRRLHARLLWWVASAMREQAATIAGIALDEALCHAVQQELAMADRLAGEAVEGAALRFAAAIDGSPRELPQLLIEALWDRRLSLFLALFARAARISFVDARALLLDPGAERLLLAMHALGLPREAIARICFTLFEADPRRDLATLADAIDALDGVDPAAGHAVLAALRLDPDYRAARAALHGDQAARAR